MNAKTLFVMVLVMSVASSTALAGAFLVGSANGAAYFFGGPPQSNADSGSFGSPRTGGSYRQYASAFTPGGIGLAGQCAGALGVQTCASGVSAQVMEAGMCQGAARFGGCGPVTASQRGTVHMNQPSHGDIQGNYATGAQTNAMLGTGCGTSIQAACVGTTQVLVH